MHSERTLPDLILLVLAVLTTFTMIMVLNFAEGFFQYVHQSSAAKLESLVLTLAICSFYLFIYICRRANDLKDKISQANTDSLIGIFNRRKGTELLKFEVERANLLNQPLSLIMLDIDDFKAINDGNGHEVGDNVLKDVMTLVQQLTRRSDILIRWGGEEFIVGCPGTEQRFAIALAERIRQAVAQYDFQLKRPVTASFGVSEYQLCEELDAFIKRADNNLYTSKKSGKNRVSSCAERETPVTG